MLFQDLLLKYLEISKPNLASHTYKCHLSVYNVYVFNKPFGLMSVGDINYLTVQELINDIQKTKAPKTAKNVLSIISQTLTLGEQLDLVKKNPCHLVKVAKFDNKRTFGYPIEIQKKFFRAVLEFEDPLADFIFFLFQGRRLNEVRLIRWHNIDFVNKEYTIEAPINKARKNMTYALTKELELRLIKRHISTEFNKSFHYVFTNPITLKPYADIRKVWQRFLKQFDLPPIRIHDIRHLIGTYSINYCNQSLESVMHTLGHTNIQTTKRYVTAQAKASKDVINGIFDNL